MPGIILFFNVVHVNLVIIIAFFNMLPGTLPNLFIYLFIFINVQTHIEYCRTCVCKYDKNK